MSLLDTRDHYKPFDNPWMFDYYVLQNQMHWMPESVPLHTDVKDWQELSKQEKYLLTQIFSIICGGTSPSIEPYRANVYTHKTLSGSFQVKNRHLENLLADKKLNKTELKDVWKDIAGHEGSVQHLDILTDEEKEIFKTANEIDQMWIVEHAAQRQDYICQAQSVNLFFTIPTATETQEVHDEYMQYVNDVHWYGMNKLKSLYYFRTNAARNAENVNLKVQRIKLDDVECIACEG